MNKYDVISIVGEGAYGVVLKCRCKHTGELRAIKKFKERDEDDENVRKTTQREVKTLRLLRQENIVELKEAFRRKGRLHLVFEYVEQTLLEVLERHTHGLDQEQVRQYVYQLVRAVGWCHAHGVVHRDIKPENLLISGDLATKPLGGSGVGRLKLCDFGFARALPAAGGSADGALPAALTEYVSTRWYRAPELLLGGGHYGKAVDVWAIGCIMAELSDGAPLFPGDSDIDQLHLTQRALGPLCAAHRAQMLCDAHVTGLPPPPSTRSAPATLEQRYSRIMAPEALSFLSATLAMDPAQRPSCAQCLAHPYLSSLARREGALPHRHRKQPQAASVPPPGDESLLAVPRSSSSSNEVSSGQLWVAAVGAAPHPAGSTSLGKKQRASLPPGPRSTGAGPDAGWTIAAWQPPPVQASQGGTGVAAGLWTAEPSDQGSTQSTARCRKRNASGSLGSESPRARAQPAPAPAPAPADAMQPHVLEVLGRGCHGMASPAAPDAALTPRGIAHQQWLSLCDADVALVACVQPAASGSGGGAVASANLVSSSAAPPSCNTADSVKRALVSTSPVPLQPRERQPTQQQQQQQQQSQRSQQPWTRAGNVPGTACSGSGGSVPQKPAHPAGTTMGSSAESAETGSLHPRRTGAGGAACAAGQMASLGTRQVPALQRSPEGTWAAISLQADLAAAAESTSSAGGRSSKHRPANTLSMLSAAAVSREPGAPSAWAPQRGAGQRWFGCHVASKCSPAAERAASSLSAAQGMSGTPLVVPLVKPIGVSSPRHRRQGTGAPPELAWSGHCATATATLLTSWQDEAAFASAPAAAPPCGFQHSSGRASQRQRAPAVCSQLPETVNDRHGAQRQLEVSCMPLLRQAGAGVGSTG